MRHAWFAAAATLLALWPSVIAHAQPPGMPVPVVGDPGPGGRRIVAGGLFGNFYTGAGEGPRPAILYIGGSEGGLAPASHWLIDSLTGAGFDVLYVCYFGCPGAPPVLASAPLETFDRALAWLKAQPGIDAARVGLVGGSKGAEAALLTAARHPELRAVVVGMPSSVSWPGITGIDPPEPSWTLHGQPVPFVPYASASLAKRGVFGLYDDALPTERLHPDAVIRVERITAPLLMVCGEADTLWPSCKMADEIAARRAAHGRSAPTILRYPDAGHGVFGPPPPMAIAALASLGGTPEGNRAARADAWPRVLAFLNTHLRP
jgi:dienelactone hydrolase